MSIKDPLLLDLPMPIPTKRLIIRPLMPGDGRQVFEAVEESREHFKLWLPWVKYVKTWEDSEKTAHEFYADFICRKAMHLAIFQDQHLVGMCGFHTINWSIPSAPIGYWCRTSAQGQGFIREACAALTVYGFEIIGLKRISILCEDTNEKSIRVAESLGFTLETRAKGLIENLQGDDLTFGRRYVRFDTKGLENL